jgi:polyisoprenoid-binding protein YceI
MAIPEARSFPAPATYEIDPAASKVSFVTRHMFGLGQVRGTFALKEGRITVTDPGAPGAGGAGDEGSAGVVVDVVVDPSRFDTGNPKRDDHIRSASYLEVAAYPEIVFRGERVERSGTEAALPGELTVRGVTRPVTVRIESFAEDGGRITATGSATIDRFDFGLTAQKGMTGRRLRVILEIVATAA